MVAKSRINRLEEQIDDLHRQRQMEPLQRWLAMQPTATLEHIRDLMTAGHTFSSALEELHVHKDS